MVTPSIRGVLLILNTHVMDYKLDAINERLASIETSINRLHQRLTEIEKEFPTTNQKINQLHEDVNYQFKKVLGAIGNITQ